MTVRQQRFGNIEPNEPGATEDQDFHFSTEQVPRRTVYSSPRTKILLGIHVRHQTSGRFRRLAAGGVPGKRPEPASTERLPSATMMRARANSTVTGQPRRLAAGKRRITGKVMPSWRRSA